MTPSPVGMRCPECASDKTTVIRGRDIGGPQIPVTIALIAVNVIVFLADIASGGGFSGGFSGELSQRGALYGPSIDIEGEVWRIVTSGFLHSGMFHVALNMMVLYFLGQMIEPAFGRAGFLAVYFTALVSGSLGSLLLNPDSAAVGASGAVFGLMGAAFVAALARGIDQMQYVIIAIIGLNLAITFLVSGIAIGGHLGGLAGGVIAAFVIDDLAGRRAIFGRSPVVPAVLGVVMTATVFIAALIAAEATTPF